MKKSKCEISDDISKLEDRVDNTIEEMASEGYEIDKFRVARSEDFNLVCMLFKEK